MSKNRFGHIEIPLERVHIELTNVCDFNCQFCPKSEMKRPYGFMETDLAKRAMSEIASNRICEKITLHIMGEPTIHADFFEILDHAKSLGVKVGLTTNGRGLGGRIGSRLLDHDLHQIDVSLQTPDRESYSLRNSGGMTFEEYVGGIFNFFSSYMTQGRNTIFKFRFLNTRFPKKSIEKRKGPIRVISSTQELRRIFRNWAERIYEIFDVHEEGKNRALKRIEKLVSYKWNVVEVYPNVFFETYLLEDWGHAFEDERIRDAWGGYCFGMRDHFGILYNGDVVLCCVDFDGHAAIGNLHVSSLKDILSSDELGKIIKGFRKFKLVHPHCKRCLGSTKLFPWLFKPIASVLALKTLKPMFYVHTRLYDERDFAAGREH
jgi:MoaA/NifB/PqqE/SkfB family radical SAM enzyme